MNISKYLKMNSSQLAEEIEKQNKKLATVKDTIALLKKLQIAANANQQTANNQPANITHITANANQQFARNTNQEPRAPQMERSVIRNG